MRASFVPDTAPQADTCTGHPPRQTPNIRTALAMDQLPHSNDGYNSLFADSQQFHSYDNAFLNGTDHNFNDAGWSLNSGNNFPNQSRGQPTVPSWQHNANHLSASSANNNFNGPPSHLPYGRSLSHSPAPFQQNQYGSFGNPQQQYRQPAFDPALFTPTTSGQDFNSNYATYGSQPQSLGTIAPQALQQETRSPALPGNNYANVNYAQNAFAQSRFAKAPAPTNVDQQALVAGIPRGSDAGSTPSSTLTRWSAPPILSAWVTTSQSASSLMSGQ